MKNAKKEKIIKTLLFLLAFIIVILYIGPVITSGEVNIGTLTGFALAGIIFLYALFFGKINGFIKETFKKKAGKTAIKAVCVLLAFCIVVSGSAFISVISDTGKSRNAESTEVAIVLGCVVNGDKPGPFLKTRIDAAYEYLSENPDAVAVLSGGQGNGESISEAQCMYNYLTEYGIEENRLLIEDKSTSTLENFKYSSELLKENGINTDKITVITNDFHEYRACKFAESCGFSPERFPSKTVWNGFMPFATREIYAIIYQVYLSALSS